MATSAPASPTWSFPSTPPVMAPSPASSPSRPSGCESPEPNCAICLGKVNNACVTDVCSHRYCFHCLLEWSKVKAECPLCKAAFRHIIHKIESEAFEKYKVPTPPPARILPDVHLIREEVGTLVNDIREFRDEISRSFVSLSLPSLLPLPEHRVRMSVGPLWRRRRGPASSEFRSDVYRRRLRVEPGSVVDVFSGRARECTPAAYRNNPTQTHKLVPWLNRELNAVLSTQPHLTGPVSQIVMEEILRSDIRSQDFHDRLLPYLGNHTEHFQHEFYHFARSFHDMIGYDRHATYVEDLGQPAQSPDDESRDDEVIFVEEVQNSRSEQTTEPARFFPGSIRLVNHSFLHSFTSAAQRQSPSLEGPSTSVARASPEVIDVERSPEVINIISDDDDADDEALVGQADPQSEATAMTEAKVEAATSDTEPWESLFWSNQPRENSQKRPAPSFHSSSSSSTEDSDHSEERRTKKKWKGKGKGKNSRTGDARSTRPKDKSTKQTSKPHCIETSILPDSDEEPLTTRFLTRSRRAPRNKGGTFEDGLAGSRCKPASRKNVVFECHVGKRDPEDLHHALPAHLLHAPSTHSDTEESTSVEDEAKLKKVKC